MCSPVRRISQRRLSLIWVWDEGGGSRSDPGIIVGDSGPSQAAGVGRGSGLQRTLKNCKFPLHRLNMCPAELGARTQSGTERTGSGGGTERGKKVFYIHR